MNSHTVLFGFLASIAVMLGGAFVLAQKQWTRQLQNTLLAIGAGFLLALAFLKLIPLSIKLLDEAAALAILAGFSVVHFFEHTVVRHLHFGEETHHEAMVSHGGALSAFAGLCIHAFFDGLSISIGMQFDFLLGILIFLAILLHKFPEGLTVGSIMTTAGFSRRIAFLAAVGIALATFLGAISVLFLEGINEQGAGYAFAFSAGTVLYVGASDLLPEVNKTDQRFPPLLVFFGMALFYVSDMFLEHFLH